MQLAIAVQSVNLVHNRITPLVHTTRRQEQIQIAVIELVLLCGIGTQVGAVLCLELDVT